MKNKILAITAGLLTAMALTACGKDPELTQFREEIDAFCTEISDIDTSINNVDAESDNAADELLGYLDQLDQDFQDFAALDFPTEFDYLESSTNFVFVHTGIDAAWLQQEFLKHAIMIRSGLDYGYREWIRISMGTYEENQKVVQVLKEIVKKAKEK